MSLTSASKVPPIQVQNLFQFYGKGTDTNSTYIELRIHRLLLSQYTVERLPKVFGSLES